MTLQTRVIIILAVLFVGMTVFRQAKRDAVIKQALIQLQQETQAPNIQETVPTPFLD